MGTSLSTKKKSVTSSSTNLSYQIVYHEASAPLIFLSHKQIDWGNQCHAIYLEMKLRNIANCWYDMKAEQLTEQSMMSGVKQSTVFTLFVSPGVCSSSYVLLELATAIRNFKPIAPVVDPEISSPDEIESLV